MSPRTFCINDITCNPKQGKETYTSSSGITYSQIATSLCTNETHCGHCYNNMNEHLWCIRQCKRFIAFVARCKHVRRVNLLHMISRGWWNSHKSWSTVYVCQVINKLNLLTTCVVLLDSLNSSISWMWLPYKRNAPSIFKNDLFFCIRDWSLTLAG